MIKKISAIVLALVLCLSVVVMPASAYELGASSEIAYVVELDKDSYSAGETVTIKVFLYGKSGLEFGTGAIIVGCNTAVFDQAENDKADVQASAVGSELNESYYKAANGSTWAWQTNTTVYNNIVAGNTAAENAMFDQYMKYTIARNTSGTHDNAGSNKNGLPADEINADAENGIPFVSFQLKLKDDIADGTVINVGVPTGAMPKNYCYMNYYKDPGNLTTVVKTTQATSEIVNSTTATIGKATATYTVTYVDGSTELGKFTVEDGAATPTIANPTKAGYTFKGWSPALADTVTGDVTYVAQWEEDLNVAELRQQIKFTKTFNSETKEYDDTIAFRVIADITNFEAIFGSAAGADDTTEGMADNTYITEAGFLYNKGAAIDETAAKAQIQSGSGAYTQQKQAYISSKAIADKYVMACVVYDVPVAEIGDTLSVVAYVKYMQNGVEKIAMCTAYEGTFEKLYNQYKTA